MVHRIIEETAKGYIWQVKPGWLEVYRHMSAAAIRVGTYHFSNAPSVALLKAQERLHNL